MNKFTQSITTVVIVIVAAYTVFQFTFWIGGAGSSAFWKFAIGAVVSIVVVVITYRLRVRTLPGGSKGSDIQGIWLLKKHLKFDPVLKKYQSLPVEPNKNYFEFNGNQFRSGDMDEKMQQLPAEYSPFSIEGDNVIFESEFFKKGHWTWKIEKGVGLVLTGETLNGKSQFIFEHYKYTK